MNIELKIKHFHDTSIQEARTLAEEQVEAHQQILAQKEVEHKYEKKKSTELFLKAEEENARREMSRAISAASLELKHQISGRQQELKDQLFAEVQQHLTAFHQTSEYETFLQDKIREAIAFAGEDPLHIYLSREDADKAAALSAKCGFTLEIAEESFGGGILAAIPSKNIQINNTFKNSLQAVYKQYVFHGGPGL